MNKLIQYIFDIGRGVGEVNSNDNDDIGGGTSEHEGIYFRSVHFLHDS